MLIGRSNDTFFQLGHWRWYNRLIRLAVIFLSGIVFCNNGEFSVLTCELLFEVSVEVILELLG